VQDTLALRRAVTTGYTNGDAIEITDGLQAEDTVVVSGQSALRDSARVEVVL
jgi:multidrug efflux pump subunit AcrA (membrane-fusion protein)